MAPQEQSPQRQADAIMARINRTGLSKTVVMSIGFHLALIAVTSIPFLLLCVKYGSIDPAVIQAEQSANQTQVEKNPVAAAAADDGVVSTPKPDGANKAEKNPISDIEKTINEVDKNPPSSSDVSMDPLDIPE